MINYMKKFGNNKMKIYYLIKQKINLQIFSNYKKKIKFKF